MKHILIVNGDQETVQLASRILETGDYHVAKVMDARTALDFLRANTPDLMLLDAHMPEMDGIELITSMK